MSANYDARRTFLIRLSLQGSFTYAREIS